MPYKKHEKLLKNIIKNIHAKIWLVKIISYICTRFWSEELIEGLKEIEFRLREEGKEEGEQAGKNISFLLDRWYRLINFITPKVKKGKVSFYPDLKWG
jgi:uncharacterized protein YdhG (YjbR/CyaY superfamily)